MDDVHHYDQIDDTYAVGLEGNGILSTVMVVGLVAILATVGIAVDTVRRLVSSRT